jgi:TPR repeat protein
MNVLKESINAELGSTSSQLILAKHYTSDEFFDYDKAEKWLNILFGKNSLYAAYELFELYSMGRERDGVVASESLLDKANEFLRIAASRNHIQALYETGIIQLCYGEAKSRGVENIVNASLAGHARAKKLLEKYDWELPDGTELVAAGDLSNWEILSSIARDLYFKIEISEQGDSKYLHYIGDFYNSAELYEEAAIWYKKAVDTGNDDAKFNLALLHHDNKLNESNLDYALDLLDSLVQKSDFDAVHITGRIYLIKEEYYKAVAFFRAAALIAPTKELKEEELGYASYFVEYISSPDEESESEEIFTHLARILR